MITVLWVLTMFIAILAESTAAVNAQAERAPNKFDLDLGKYLWRQIAVLMGWRLNTGVSELDPDDLHLTVGSLLDRVDGQLTRALQGRHAYSSARRRTTWSSVPATRPADVAERYRKMALRSGLTGLDEVSDPPVAPNALPNIVVPPVPARLPASSQRKANGAKGAATNPKTPKTPTPKRSKGSKTGNATAKPASDTHDIFTVSSDGEQSGESVDTDRVFCGACSRRTGLVVKCDGEGCIVARHIRTWDVPTTAEHLAELGFNSYARHFREKQYNGAVLLEVTADDIAEMPESSNLLRRGFLRHILQLQKTDGIN